MSEAKLKEAGIFNPETVKQRLDQLLSRPAPNTASGHYQTMKLEWVLFLVLTIQILHELFIKKTARCFSPD
jgi:hypothetical protein